MGIFTKNDRKQIELSQEALQEKKQKSSACSQEIAEVLKKHNCEMSIRQEIVVISK